MESKSSEILIVDELDDTSHISEVRSKDLHTNSILVQTPSSENSTLTQTLECGEDIDSGCRTPTEFIFDPFAPGPEELCLAPKTKRKNCGTNPSRRQLNLSFDLSFPMIDLEREFEELDKEEKEEVHNICKSLLDLIILDVMEICEEKVLSDEEDEDEDEEGYKTPTDIPLLTGFADACPGAPIGPSLQMRSNLKRELCRKLDFDLD